MILISNLTSVYVQNPFALTWIITEKIIKMSISEVFGQESGIIANEFGLLSFKKLNF